jgi:hypothetical protein
LAGNFESRRDFILGLEQTKKNVNNHDGHPSVAMDYAELLGRRVLHDEFGGRP